MTPNWEISWSNLFEAPTAAEAVAQALGQLDDAVNRACGATILRVRNVETGHTLTYDISTQLVS
jgi:hypothetical protein